MADFGEWVLGTKLGAGGMGTVYRATRGAEVAAVKIINPGLATDDEFRRRFRREIEISQRVRGPNLARVIDFDVEGETPWLATELLSGPTLDQAIQEHGPLRNQQLIDVAVGVARGLADLHAAEVTHRDVKPANIILAERGPVILDLGIAAAAELTSMTATGFRIGSAGWMSPEQVEGEPTGPPTDVFSWGLAMAFAASGQNPYGTGSADALLYRVVHHEPGLSSVPSMWTPILRTALARRPEDRPSARTLQELAADPGGSAALLPTVMEGAAEPTTPVTMADHSVGPALTPARRPHRVPRLLVAGLVAALLVMFSAAGYWYIDQRDPATAEASQEAPSSGATPPADTANTTDPAAEEATTAPATGAELPLFNDPVSTERPRTMAKFGRFLSDHVQEEVRVDITWSGGIGSVDETGTAGEVKGLAACDPTCKSPIQGMLVSASGLPSSRDVTFSGVGEMWQMTGTFFVQSATIETGGIYFVELRVAGTPPKPAQEVEEVEVTSGSCDVVEGEYLDYPGRPLSIAMANEYSPHVLLVQDLLNANSALFGYSCIPETGYFDPETERAVREYQASTDLEVDGVVGQNTYTALILYFE